jgi:hypothetical protein
MAETYPQKLGITFPKLTSLSLCFSENPGRLIFKQPVQQQSGMHPRQHANASSGIAISLPCQQQQGNLGRGLAQRLD